MALSRFIPLAVSIGVPFAAGILGNAVSRDRLDTWYKGLKKPWFNPPNWIFGPVWSLLYICMGTSSFLVWSQGGFSAQALPLAVYGAHIAFNAAWTPLFFAAKRMDLAFVDIALMWGSLASSIYLFYPVNRTAAFLLVPYLAWVSFAALLNYKIWRLNLKPAVKIDQD